MKRVQQTHVIAKTPTPEATLENYTPGGWVEDICSLALVAMVSLSMALGAPEPIDCGADRDAPTLEGCQP